MYLVAIGWIYVVLLMSVAEATSGSGTLLGAVFTFLLYGVLPLSILMYLLRTPGRRAARRAQESEQAVATPTDPDRGGHAAGDTVAPKRKEP